MQCYIQWSPLIECADAFLFSISSFFSAVAVPRRHVGLLSIKGTDFRVDLSPLKTVRPFMWDHVCLSQTGIDPLDLSRVQSYLQHKVLASYVHV